MSSPATRYIRDLIWGAETPQQRPNDRRNASEQRRGKLATRNGENMWIVDDQLEEILDSRESRLETMNAALKEGEAWATGVKNSVLRGACESTRGLAEMTMKYMFGKEILYDHYFADMTIFDLIENAGRLVLAIVEQAKTEGISGNALVPQHLPV